MSIDIVQRVVTTATVENFPLEIPILNRYWEILKAEMKNIIGLYTMYIIFILYSIIIQF